MFNESSDSEFNNYVLGEIKRAEAFSKSAHSGNSRRVLLNLKSTLSINTNSPTIELGEFTLMVYEAQKPVVVRNAISKWRALTLWPDSEYILSKLGGLNLDVISQKDAFLRGTDDFEAQGKLHHDSQRLFGKFYVFEALL